VLDPSRLAVGGTSAGPNLATVVARLARDRRHPPLVLQLLVYPPTDHAAVADVPGTAFSRAGMTRHWSQYLREAADGNDPRASPIREADLSGLPPALVITAELDPLTEEAEEYARRLVAAGVPVDVRRFARARHGFFSSPTVQGRAARSAATAALREAFGS
jgi:acetyl esterase